MKAGCVISRRKTGSSFFPPLSFFHKFFFTAEENFESKQAEEPRETRTDMCTVGGGEVVDFCRIQINRRSDNSERGGDRGSPSPSPLSPVTSSEEEEGEHS